jgi:hypothetical protein
MTVLIITLHSTQTDSVVRPLSKSKYAWTEKSIKNFGSDFEIINVWSKILFNPLILVSILILMLSVH